MRFGAGKRESVNKGAVPRINNLITAIASRVRDNTDKLEDLQPVLEFLASCYPETYLRLVDLVLQKQSDERSLRDAERYLKAYLETAEVAEKKQAWTQLIDLYTKLNDTVGEVHALCELALLPTSSVADVSNVANLLNSRIRDLKNQRIEDAWSHEVQELLLEVIKVLEHKLDKFSATDCSRLAWLYLNVGNRDRARDIAKRGLIKRPDNEYCHRLIEILET